jgi:hypothetical protein
MGLIWIIVVLFSALGIAIGIFNLKLKEQVYLNTLKFETELEKPIPLTLLPKAMTIEDLNQFAVNICNRELAILTQCIERQINSLSPSLSTFCQDVVNHERSGDDLTTNVQYLWRYLPSGMGSSSNVGRLINIWNAPQKFGLYYVEDLPPYIRYFITNIIPQEYRTYFWTQRIVDYRYVKPTDDRKATPCAYSGIIIPP